MSPRLAGPSSSRHEGTAPPRTRSPLGTEARVRFVVGLSGGMLLLAAIWITPRARIGPKTALSDRGRASVLETCARALPLLRPLVGFSLWVDAAGALEGMREEEGIARLRAFTRWLAGDPRAWEMAVSLLASIPPSVEAPDGLAGEARALVTDAIRLHPTDARLRFRRGWLAIREGIPIRENPTPPAVSSRREPERISREEPEGISDREGAREDSRSRRITALVSGLEDVEAALALDPGLRVALEWLAEGLRALAREEALGGGDPGPAAALWEKAGGAYAKLEKLHATAAGAFARYCRSLASILQAGAVGGGASGEKVSRGLALLRDFPFDDTARVLGDARAASDPHPRKP